jgi:hypothetical protein
MRLLYSTDHGWETINWAILILEKKNKKSFHFFDIISSIGSEIKKNDKNDPGEASDNFYPPNWACQNMRITINTTL